jgi:glucose/arabinose dehydrogenase
MSLRKEFSLAGAAGVALVGLAVMLLAAQAVSHAAPLAPNAVTAVQYASGLNEPVDIANTGIATDTRLFVVERAGRIRVITSNGVTGTVLGTNFLDIEPVVDSETNVEMGLLGMAFSPNYQSDGQFFVYYNNTDGDINLARYTVSGNPNVANITGTVVMTITHNTANNHNGGDLAFGPDGYLYLAPGDGGSTPQFAQDTSKLLGKVLRINVIGVPTYTIPASNPFTTTAPLDEIWAIGLRNPFRLSFDRLTGDLYVADVGQSAWEEVNHQPAGVGGLNYGWTCYEGNHEHNTSGCLPIGSFTFPVAEYCNEAQGPSCDDGGRAVIGGHVYRGSVYPGMYGYYFYADNSSSRFWAMQASAPWTVTPLSISNVASPGGFGENVAGELFVTAMGTGGIYRLQGNIVPVIQTPLWMPLVRN